MTKRMLVDATHPEETRVAIVESYRDGNRLEDLDFDLASKPLLKGNIYLAKVMRVEPSLQAAFVEYGGNRHGFLSFSEIHPDYFRIPMADRPEDEDDQAGIDDDTIEQMSDDMDDGQDDRTLDNDAPVEIDTTPAVDSGESPAACGTEAPQPVVENTLATPTSVLAEPVPSEAPAVISVLPVMEHTDDGLNDVGLITDFGNAVIPSAANPDELAPPEATPVESVGGEMTERFVRQHRPRYKIQEVLKRGQVMLIQVVKEERGNKGAALTTFLSLAGRYCVLMPNTDHGGGVSRKITNHQDRRRMKEILDQLEIPEGMAVILRTAGMEQDPPEIQRDLEYLLRLWNNIREQTLQSTAPSLIYEEANLIKRSVRDLYSQEISEILVAGERGYELARDFMRAIMPDDVEKIKVYKDSIPLFFRYNVENQIDTLHNPVVQLRSGGYLVINPTEALVSIDVNSGRATRERHIEETALKTNLEAAEEVARQLRLRDLAGLVVIDFIDMEDGRNNSAVERRLKESMKNDRARLQIGRISPFGLMELSRQRLRPSLLEINFEKCPHCAGLGLVRSIDSAALSILRAIEEEGIKQRSAEIILNVPTKVALYLLNQKRASIVALEQRYDLHVLLHSDDTLTTSEHKMERARNRTTNRSAAPAVNTDQILAETERDIPPATPYAEPVEGESAEGTEGQQPAGSNDNSQRFGRRRFRDRNSSSNNNNNNRRGGGRRDPRNNNRQETSLPEGVIPPVSDNVQPVAMVEGLEGAAVDPESIGNNVAANQSREPFNSSDDSHRRRRRGRRGGRRRNGGSDNREGAPEGREGRPQGGNREGGWNNRRPRYNQDNAGNQTSAPAAPYVPMTIHELDTTPRDPAPRSSSVSSNAPGFSSGTSAHEVVNPPVDRPKGGWWRRLTGQE